MNFFQAKFQSGLRNFFLSETAKFGVPVCPTMRVKKIRKTDYFSDLFVHMDYFYVSHAYWTKCLKHKRHCPMSCWKNITGKIYFCPLAWCLSNWKCVVYSYSLDNHYVSLLLDKISLCVSFIFVQPYLSNQCPVWKYCPKFIWQSLCVCFIWVKCPLYWQYVQLDLSCPTWFVRPTLTLSETGGLDGLNFLQPWGIAHN